jgi:uncharacterized protein YjaZ
MVERYQQVLDQKLITNLENHLASWTEKLHELLPEAPQDLTIEWNNRWLIPETGTGGATLSKRKIELAFDPTYDGNKEDKIVDLKGSYFHEVFHTVQGWTFEDTAGKEISAIDSAIYEGAATVFERDRAKTKPLWGLKDDDETMLKWLEEVRNLPNDYDYRKYKFFDSDTGRRWILYPVGTFIVDQALENNPDIVIEDMATISPVQILALAKL